MNSTEDENRHNKNTIQGFQKQKHLVVATRQFTHQETVVFLDELFGTAWKFGIVELNVLVYKTNSSWSLITYFPFIDENCIAVTHKTLATFTIANYTRLENMGWNELYLPKMRNLNKCPVNVVVYPCEPYVFESREIGRKYDGIEIRVIDAVALAMNFTPNYILPEDEHGNVWPNKSNDYYLKTVTGLLCQSSTLEKPKCALNFKICLQSLIR